MLNDVELDQSPHILIASQRTLYESMFIVHSIHSCRIAEATEQQTVKTSDRLRAFRSHLVRNLPPKIEEKQF